MPNTKTHVKILNILAPILKTFHGVKKGPTATVFQKKVKKDGSVSNSKFKIAESGDSEGFAWMGAVPFGWAKQDIFYKPTGNHNYFELQKIGKVEPSQKKTQDKLISYGSSLLY